MAKLKGIDVITAIKGTVFVNDTNPHTGQYAAIYSTSDSLEVDEVLDQNGDDITSNLGLGSGITIPKGTLITTSKEYMSSVTLGAGTANLINNA